MGLNLMQLLGALQSNRNPMVVLEQIMGQNAGNPQIAQAMKLINGKNQSQLRQVAENMARERGIDLRQLASGMGLNLPK